MRYAVVGHVEWVDFARVPHLPRSGEIVDAEETWAEVAGGGAVAAAVLVRLAGDATLFTALGADELGDRCREGLEALGVRVEAAPLDVAQRRAFTHVEPGGERTITVLGERLGPAGAENLAWEDLRGAEAVYFVSGGAEALRAVRMARHVVATARALPTLIGAGVEVDVLLGSGSDEGERYSPGALDPPPRAVVRTAGADGGTWERADGSTGSWPGAVVPGPVEDAYGAGDSFAAGLTFALGAGEDLPAACRFGADQGAEALTRRGAHGAAGA